MMQYILWVVNKSTIQQRACHGREEQEQQRQQQQHMHQRETERARESLLGTILGLMRELKGRAKARVGTFNSKKAASTLWAYVTMGRDPAYRMR